MKFSSKKFGNKLGVLASKDHTGVKNSVKEIAQFIIKSGKTNKLSEIIRHFKTSYNKETNTVDITVTASKKEFIPEIKEFAGMKASVKEIVDPSLLGGLIIQTDDLLLDGSIKGKLSKLKSVAKSR